MQVFYVVEDWDSEWYECESPCDDLASGFDRWTAQTCAEDAFHNHDGWESEWPLIISLYESPYPEGYKATFEIDIEQVPSFTATPTEKPNA